MPNSLRPPVILLAEDNDADALLARAALADLGANVDLRRVENGSQCMAYLKREPPYAGAPRPDLVLLDLNLPLVDGLHVLAQVAGDPQLSALPVVILTTSHHQRDVSAAYRLRCNAYVVKPLDFATFGEAIEGIWRHWFELATLPTTAPNDAALPE